MKSENLDREVPLLPEPPTIVYQMHDGTHQWTVKLLDSERAALAGNVQFEIASLDSRVGYEIAKDLALDLSIESGLIWNWLIKQEIQKHGSVLLTVYTDSEHAAKIPEASAKLRERGTLIPERPITMLTEATYDSNLKFIIVVRNDVPGHIVEEYRPFLVRLALEATLRTLCGMEERKAITEAVKLVETL